MQFTRRGFVASVAATLVVACRSTLDSGKSAPDSGDSGEPVDGDDTGEPADTGDNTGTGPNLAALPAGAYDVGDWNGFLAAMTGAGSTFVDKTGVVMRRLTDATAPLANLSYGMTYASGGAKLSQAFGDARDTYWLIYQAFVTRTEQARETRLAKVQRGVGVLTDVTFAPPALSAGRLSYSFSYRAGEEHILYYVGEDQRIHRYDVDAGAPAPDARFSNADATWPGVDMAAYPGWLQMSWDGGRIAWVAPYTSPSELHHLDLDAGIHTVYDEPATLVQVNDIRLSRGADAVCAIAGDDGTKALWFVSENRVTEFFSTIPGTQGHCDCGEAVLYTVDANGTHLIWSRSTFGAAPGEDGGPWSGVVETLAEGSAPDHVIIDGDYHCNMTWDQRGAGGEEVFCIDNDLTSPYKNTANGWRVAEGEIYRTTVSFGIYGSAMIGVSGVLIWNGSTVAGVFTGHLERAESVAVMTAGTWFWDGSELYVWMTDGASPADRVRIVNATLLGEAIGYIRQADGALTKLCYDYRNEADYAYTRSVFANWSIDGRMCVFASNLGVQGGRTDLLLVEVP